MQFRVIVVTDPQTNTPTNTQTGPITIHCATASLHPVCNELHKCFLHISPAIANYSWEWLTMLSLDIHFTQKVTLLQRNWKPYHLAHNLSCPTSSCRASVLDCTSVLFIFLNFIMKSYTRYTIKIKGKSKILSIQHPDNINFWPVKASEA